MNVEYDCKFEEMKMYIPFLESMIRRLESTSSASNPRQAQLDKIRSLRDLLMDKKKRMKMENLLKCEQVLINLYEKVEQRDALPEVKQNIIQTSKNNTDLSIARNKLKSAVSKIQNTSMETLPEIARASETEALYVPGSKEPALFQRRPNKSSVSPSRTSQNKIIETSPQISKRNYTRVLQSPEPSQSAWPVEENPTVKTPFPTKKRSPKKSPRRKSPSHHKKDRKKSSKNKAKHLSKDLNITLNVPEERLNSLNTKDILSRIINCSDKDVDIDTLRELKTQILDELKETGTNEDISELILKSYKKKSKIGSKVDEVEEGELSDSESEAINNIYGSLVVEPPTASASSLKTDKDKSRKIQICLVINSEKTKDTKTRTVPVDLSDFESLLKENQSYESNVSVKSDSVEELSQSKLGEVNQSTVVNRDDSETNKNILCNHDESKKENDKENDRKETLLQSDQDDKAAKQEQEKFLESKESNKPNFYKPISEQDLSLGKQRTEAGFKNNVAKFSHEKPVNEESSTDTNVKAEASEVQIPLLDPPKIVSEIDILQALKKEILNETNNVLSNDSEPPPLHQPKITKVANANEIGSKKRISIENYKAKTNPPSQTTDNKVSKYTVKDDCKKQSLKLTEKECERFKFMSKLIFDEISEEENEDKESHSLDGIYDNFAPKSPDHEDFADTGIRPPVIIPSDRVQTAVVKVERDVDMRKMFPYLQTASKEINNLSPTCQEQTHTSYPSDKEIQNDHVNMPLFDSGMKRDLNTKTESLNPHLANLDSTSNLPKKSANTPAPSIQNIKAPVTLNVNNPIKNIIMSPSVHPNMTPNIQNMIPALAPHMIPNVVPNVTPNARYDMTPSRQTVDCDNFANRKHVYAPMFPVENRDKSETFRDNKPHPWENQLHPWENTPQAWESKPHPWENKPQPWENSDLNNASFWEDIDCRNLSNRPPFEPFQNSPRCDRFSFDSDHRAECPPTPSHGFGRLDCPPIPNPSFGRVDVPPAQIRPFGRLDCLTTPNHPFGRPDSDRSLPFVRADFNQSFQNKLLGKSLDPRISRKPEYDYHQRGDDCERGFSYDNNYHSNSYRSDRNNRSNSTEYPRKYQREKSIGHNERNRSFENKKVYDNSGRNHRDSRRETNTGRYTRDIDNDRLFTRNRNAGSKSYNYRHQEDPKIYDDRDRRHNREKSVGRSSRSTIRDSSASKIVESQGDQFLTVDTSINSSFQDKNDRKNLNSSFNARRHRAASVGRVLSSDFNSEKNEVLCNLNDKNRKRDFRRASSVGRDLKESKLNFQDIKNDLKSFRLRGESKWNKEINIKDNLSQNSNDSYKSSYSHKRKDIECSNVVSPGNSKYSPRQNIRDPRVRRENKFENKNNPQDNFRAKVSDSKKYGINYSNDNITKGNIIGPGYGVKNYKIPKLKRHPEVVVNKDQKNDANLKDNEPKISEKDDSDMKIIDKSKDEKEQNISKNKTFDSEQTNKPSKCEIDNVKKNKRTKKVSESENEKLVTEEPKSQVLPDIKTIGVDTNEHSQRDKKVEENNALNISNEKIEKRITRSVSKSLSRDTSMETSPIKRPKRGKKMVAYDSDDNDKTIEKDTSSDDNKPEISNSTSSKIDIAVRIKSIAETKEDMCKKPDKCLDRVISNINSNFAMDELEIFSDNIASDPVIDNINDLIADLDDDLDSSKPVMDNSFTEELSLETMLENISSPESNEASQNLKENATNNTEKNKESELNSVDDTKNISLSHNKESNTLEIHENTKTFHEIPNNNSLAIEAQNNSSNETIVKNMDNILHDNTVKDNELAETSPEDICSKEAIVTTSEDRETFESAQERVKGTETIIQLAPDSTMKTNVTDNDSQRNLPDSTNNLSCDMNSDISSTRIETSRIDAEPSSSHTSSSNEKSSIDKLLKNKIKEMKEILSLLDEQSENEKIKKKLEKLCELVSDDEESLSTEKDLDKVNNDYSETKSYESKNFNADNETNTHDASNRTDLLKQAKKENEIETNVNQITSSMEGDQNESSLKLSESYTENTTNTKEANQKTTNFGEKDNSQPKENDDSKEQDNSISKDHPEITSKNARKTVTKRGKKKSITNVPTEERRVTRSDAANLRFDNPVVKKPSRELQKLQRDIREMFIGDDVLNANGIRNCRLAKLVDETKTQKDDTSSNENKKPVVLLKKCNELNVEDDTSTEKTLRKKKVKNKKNVLKPKQLSENLESKSALTEFDNVDPYEFETDSLNETIDISLLNDKNVTSESECESLVSSKSFGSMEQLLGDPRKKKRKRKKGWKAGVIKSKNKKKKLETQVTELSNDKIEIEKNVSKSDPNCFTDKTYYFDKSQTTYECRLCSYNGTEIVYHYKKQHPHLEIPISRMNPATALEAIAESEKINFQVVSKLPSKKYICRFCSKQFCSGWKKPFLESFFWHVVKVHTGEYKQSCSECLNVTRCPFSLDIPSPPQEKGQLLGYICEKCNYTQISLENLKTHVKLRHNDEQTPVDTINLSSSTKTLMNNFMMENEEVKNANTDDMLLHDKSDCVEELNKIIETKDLKNKDEENTCENVNVFKTSKIKSKITFENDNTDELLNFNDPDAVKVEPEFNENQEDINDNDSHCEAEQQVHDLQPSDSEKTEEQNIFNDIFNYPHFKIKYPESGPKEYICCINGNDLHYRTPLLISFKKHVQLKHSENWDGYCFICKVIVTPQGSHQFKDCLQHFLDQHMDDFPVFEEVSDQAKQNDIESTSNQSCIESSNQEGYTKPYINVRPLSQLISRTTISEESTSPLPVIESVVSLGSAVEYRYNSSCVKTQKPETTKEYKYEEAQVEIMSSKHHVVLGAMMSHVKLVQVFKCAGRFCSFTTDAAEDALVHASTHTEIGGENSLRCAYCDFDSSGNAIDLITHVFKEHGCCQYACSLCFYRAAESYLVNYHIMRAHADAGKVPVLYTSFHTPSENKEETSLTREIAVPYYRCCAYMGTKNRCRFRTYTPGKFCNHLKTKHSTLPEHICFMCSGVFKTPSDLIRHFKRHGLKLYQCSWCIYGVDTETELMHHASAKHPDRQPKSYLRIITDEKIDSKVLPLAQLNLPDIPAVEIKSTNVKDNAIKEAKRSIELEKLIGNTTSMIESKASQIETSSAETRTHSAEVCHAVNETVKNTSLSMDQTKLDDGNQTGNHLTSTLTNEVETLKKSSQNISDVVLCLDSDEEDASQNIIDLSKDLVEKLPPQKLLHMTQLFLCAGCNLTFKNGSGFKKHISACFNQVSGPIPCAHCPLQIKKTQIISHYINTHAQLSDFACSRCKGKFSSLAAVKEHDKNCPIRQVPSDSHENSKADQSIEKPGARCKRKRSLLSKDKALELPEKMKRFGPSDVHLLPINPILDESVFCSLCEFRTKVRLNMVRHLQLHAEQQPVPQTAPVNPVPHLETNEKHFDKMVNLASSSLAPRPMDKNKNDGNATITLMIPPETADRYPKYVPEKHRHTCGAKGCSYISVDESMFKFHWETLHSGTSEFRCVHCPPQQQLDASRPLTAVRIIAHLKMHDATLYACSLCSYYHFKRNIVENHLANVHKSGQVMVVRDEVSNLTPVASQAQATAPTMDLKPWQCGICNFKSLLRPEVVEHCAKIHNSKMQYKCSYCAFRTSNCENVRKHQSKSHSDKNEEIFYYYYREGSVPNDVDGTPLWQKQSQKFDEPKIKSECVTDASSPQTSLPIQTPTPVNTDNCRVDLNIVKKEVIDAAEDSIENLCKDFGDFCEPNGLKFKCPLCKIVVEDTADAMQSHLYEELKYRKWGCSICSYKAFHEAGLSVHMQLEHRQNKEPIALQVDNRIETWVAKFLKHQMDLIKMNKENLTKQAEIMRSIPGSSRTKSPVNVPETSQSSDSSTNKPTMVELEKLFGSFGSSVCMSFCCPKCHSVIKDESVMQSHLENELNKIRWFCSECSITFQHYHEAQFHCRSVHTGQSAWPMEATRDPSVRSAWVAAVIHIQKLSMNYMPLPSKSFEKDTEKQESAPDNSLLVIRYEERVSTPEDIMARRTPIVNSEFEDSQDEIIDRLKVVTLNCLHCNYKTIKPRILREHTLRHYNLKTSSCGYCGLSGSKRSLDFHMKSAHPNQPLKLVPTAIPTEPPLEFLLKQTKTLPDFTKVICLVCQNAFTELEALTHLHDKIPTSFGKKGDVVVKCGVCFGLYSDVNAYFDHHKSFHADMSVNYVFCKLNTITNESKTMMYACNICDLKFALMRDIKLHSDYNHHSQLKYTIVPKNPDPQTVDLEEIETGSKRSMPMSDSSPLKKVARKSTTKLPMNNATARKSTTKLPLTYVEEYSYYGTQPATEGLENVTTLMSFCNTMVPFKFEKLSKIININPNVVVDKLNK